MSFDYELFFGQRTGTVERTLLQPSQAIHDLAVRHGASLVFFVDAGFLLRLRAEGLRSPALMREYDQVVRQLEHFAAAGHEIQLHVHPHWEDARWTGECWDLDTRRYRLHDFNGHDIRQIVRRYAEALRAITGGEGVFAYRAGGWMIQPFARIGEGLREAGICVDSTVIPGGKCVGENRSFDFSGAPAAGHWFFDDDPLVEKADGEFLEVPIASRKVSPAFYWRLVLETRIRPDMHRPLSDGAAMPTSRSDVLSRLTRGTWSIVSMDGYRASFLGDACRRYERAGCPDFVVIGHPKLASRYSLQQLERFLLEREAGEFVGYGNYLPLFANRHNERHAARDRLGAADEARIS